eukprot:1714251-Rhodomonas_salina.2
MDLDEANVVAIHCLGGQFPPSQCSRARPFPPPLCARAVLDHSQHPPAPTRPCARCARCLSPCARAQPCRLKALRDGARQGADRGVRVRDHDVDGHVPDSDRRDELLRGAADGPSAGQEARAGEPAPVSACTQPGMSVEH